MEALQKENDELKEELLMTLQEKIDDLKEKIKKQKEINELKQENEYAVRCVSMIEQCRICLDCACNYHYCECNKEYFNQFSVCCIYCGSETNNPEAVCKKCALDDIMTQREIRFAFNKWKHV